MKVFIVQAILVFDEFDSNRELEVFDSQEKAALS